ncbi:hypothetical protein K461DRAFT_313474 [Myriangium duriaei CBS 260.36]|uniref:Uncharacterized protein n=1 Tax=Myriangium duriaei CBS 260.36 TaxID=1168546 RepID=A0A9P4J009_9PEZI|nr:hypothetical protein K461DRAFT_313474 [Myriangium duriaei CBS 260.36]
MEIRGWDLLWYKFYDLVQWWILELLAMRFEFFVAVKAMAACHRYGSYEYDDENAPNWCLPETDISQECQLVVFQGFLGVTKGYDAPNEDQDRFLQEFTSINLFYGEIPKAHQYSNNRGLRGSPLEFDLEHGINLVAFAKAYRLFHPNAVFAKGRINVPYCAWPMPMLTGARYSRFNFHTPEGRLYKWNKVPFDMPLATRIWQYFVNCELNGKLPFARLIMTTLVICAEDRNGVEVSLNALAEISNKHGWNFMIPQPTSWTNDVEKLGVDSVWEGQSIAVVVVKAVKVAWTASDGSSETDRTKMSNSASVVEWNLPEGSPSISYTYWGPVVTVDPTVTEVVLTCSPSCDAWRPTVTIGPWAQVTPPPTASNGTYDIFLTYPRLVEDVDPTNTTNITTETVTASDGRAVMLTQSAHCDIVSNTVVPYCTERVWGSDEFLDFNISDSPPKSSLWAISLTPVTITAGVDKLTGSSPSTRSITTAISTSSSASTSSSSAAINSCITNIRMLGMVCLLVAFLRLSHISLCCMLLDGVQKRVKAKDVGQAVAMIVGPVALLPGSVTSRTLASAITPDTPPGNERFASSPNNAALGLKKRLQQDKVRMGKGYAVAGHPSRTLRGDSTLESCSLSQNTLWRIAACDNPSRTVEAAYPFFCRLSCSSDPEATPSAGSENRLRTAAQGTSLERRVNDVAAQLSFGAREVAA